MISTDTRHGLQLLARAIAGNRLFPLLLTTAMVGVTYWLGG